MNRIVTDRVRTRVSLFIYTLLSMFTVHSLLDQGLADPSIVKKKRAKKKAKAKAKSDALTATAMTRPSDFTSVKTWDMMPALRTQDWRGFFRRPKQQAWCSRRLWDGVLLLGLGARPEGNPKYIVLRTINTVCLK